MLQRALHQQTNVLDEPVLPVGAVAPPATGCQKLLTTHAELGERKPLVSNTDNCTYLNQVKPGTGPYIYIPNI